ncbi:MAG TPA: M48 family metalloprotease [Pyrinomonadaceae bacterium]|jgi:Zn-dependent protease with chaperone function|nr:M48 family metalloprotease [Pyrinomonadaceae bacterium]
MRLFAARSLVILSICIVSSVPGLSQILSTEPPPPAQQQTQQQVYPRDPAREQRILQELQKTAPKAVQTFKKATEALDGGDYGQAIPLYNEVLKQAPNFEPALRRLGYALIDSGKRKEGLELTQKALSLNRSADNLLGQATALINPGPDNQESTPAEIAQALALAKESFEKGGKKDKDAMMVIAELSFVSNKMDDFNKAALALKEIAPNDMATHYYNGIRLANFGAYASAQEEIRQAETAGLPHEEAERIFLAIANAQEAQTQQTVIPGGKYIAYGLYFFAAWIVGLILLFFVGKILSARTLYSVENSDPNDITGGGQAGLRKIYRAVITFGGVYYYISQPVVVLLIIALTIGAALFFLTVGIVPVKLLFIFGLVGLITIFYMVRSIFVRIKAEDPGRALSEQEAPGLWALARDVAQTVQTRPVNEIRVTPGTDLAVYERGGMWAKMNDKADRILILGTAVLNDFKQNSFRAVLAHEYGHFSNRDTAGGAMAMRVNNHIIHLAEAMALSGTATFYNIAFQFLRLYHFIFRRITHGATRLQEILADRVAAYQYGPDTFREGLTHVIRREVEFSHLANKEIGEAIKANRMIQNLYELSAQDDDVKKNLEEEMNKFLTRPTTEDDTHPSPQDRFRLTSGVKARETAPLTGMVWDLFKDRGALTNEMNDLLEKAVRAKI